MATKMNTKSRGKEDKGKGIKGVTQSNEDSGDLDFSLLRKPIHTSVTGFAQARKIFDLATEELRDLLSKECDILYECKVCRNIFRSLANYVSHKRVYCKEKFNSSIHGHFIKSTATINEIIQIKSTEEGYQESLKVINGTQSMETDDADEDRIPLTKDLTAVLEKIAKTKGIICNGNKGLDVVLQKIPSSNVAVFQNVDEKDSDNMRTQVRELDNILSKDKAVLQSDGNFTIESSKDPDEPPPNPDSVIQISDDEDNDDDRDENDVLKCKICDLQFSTQKTLRFHRKYKHLESRLVYPCPDCLEIFSTSWSVFRHLFKVHRKTAAQIRRLRESIQSKAFKMDNPPAFYEKRKNTIKPVAAQKITDEERLDQENQAWMDNMEGDSEVPRCGGCGRTFERRAALAAHTHTCQPRSRALARRPEGKKIEIQIRKDYNKGPSGLTIYKANSNENKPPPENIETTTKSIDENEKNADEEEKDIDIEEMDVGEEDQNSNDSAESLERSLQADVKPELNLPYAMQAEKSNLAAFKQRIQSDIDYSKNLCKKCDSKYTSVLELYEHIAGHFKWMRYACKLCNFKHYNFEKLPEHVKVVHKLKGDSDFYFSTVKAIDGTEAMISSRCLVESECAIETNEVNESSPGSRRLSRCSSDSSRLSDDSSSSSTIKELGSRKRKLGQNKTYPKKKKEVTSNDDGVDQKDEEMTIDKVLKVIIGDKVTTSSVKVFEENSSDMEDVEDKITKRHAINNKLSVVPRRPVRKRTKPKNEDFEYDLSNLLKLEAQGYRDSQTGNNSKSTQSKKKNQESSSHFDNINKYCCGALSTLSRKAVETSAAHMKTASFAVYSIHKDQRSSNIFVRPMLPKIISRGDKMSPKIDVNDELKDKFCPNKVSKGTEPTPKPSKETTINTPVSEEQDKNVDDSKTIHKDTTLDKNNTEKPKYNIKLISKDDTEKPKYKVTLRSKDDIDTSKEDTKRPKYKTKLNSKDDNDTSLTQEQNNPHKSDNSSVEKLKTNRAMPAVVPIKFRRQSLDLMKNPIINKNITDFTKAGMKTKILVIKPINRNKDGTRAINSSLQFQTIKLKETNASSTSNEDKSSDQVVVVKVPKVDCAISRPFTDKCTANSEKSTPSINSNVENISHEFSEKKNEDNTASKQDTENKDTSEAKVDENCKTYVDNEIKTENISSESVPNTVVQHYVTDQSNNHKTVETSK